MKICIDAGHGGSDPGACGKEGLKESAVNLAICQYLASKLEDLGCAVLFTRSSEIYVPLGIRAGIANDWNADICLSIHLNSDGDFANGIETLYKTANGKALATPIQNRLIAATGDRDRGLVCRNDLYILNATKMPCCLVEAGFISNPSFEAKLRTAEYQRLIATAIAGGLADFLNLAPRAQPA
jgi:N-acetylmuramoyl-L-alanine amidase